MLKARANAKILNKEDDPGYDWRTEVSQDALEPVVQDAMKWVQLLQQSTCTERQEIALTMQMLTQKLDAF